MEENTLKLSHYDDEKGKYQSHEVFIRECNSCLCTLIGYGETKKEAIIDFKNKFNEFYEKITNLKDKLSNYDDCEKNIEEVE